MNLKPAEIRAFKASESVVLIRDEEQQPGVIPIETEKTPDGATLNKLAIKVTASKRLKSGKWEILHVVQDFRPTLLARGEGIDGTGYTHSAHHALADAGEVIDEETLKQFQAISRKNRAERTKASPTERKRQEKRVQSVLREAVKELGPEAGTELLASIERQIREAVER